MTSRVLASNGDGVFGPDRCRFMKNAVLDIPLNLLDLLKGLFLI